MKLVSKDKVIAIGRIGALIRESLNHDLSTLKLLDDKGKEISFDFSKLKGGKKKAKKIRRSERDLIIAELEEKGISYRKNSKTETLRKKLDELS